MMICCRLVPNLLRIYFGMTQPSGNVTKCPDGAGKHLSKARQREGVTYSCVWEEFYPNYNRFYQIPAVIGHTPLHTFDLHTSPLAWLLAIDGTWLERTVQDVYVSLFSAPSIWECVCRHFTVTLCWQGQGSLETVLVSSTMTNTVNQQWGPAFSEYSQHSSPLDEGEVLSVAFLKHI